MKRKQTKMWVCSDGTRLRICDMEDSHLLNAINLLERMADAKTNELINSGYSALEFLQGGMALDLAECNIGYLEEYGVDPNEISPLYENLIMERERRKI